MQAIVMMMENAKNIAEQIVPAIANPVGKPAAFDFFMDKMPRMRPAIAVPMPTKAQDNGKDAKPRTSEAIAMPLPGSHTSCGGAYGCWYWGGCGGYCCDGYCGGGACGGYCGGCC